jgi:hypothetical protein
MVAPVSQQPRPPQPARQAPRQRILEVHDRAGWVVGAYRIGRDWPAKYAAPDLNAQGNDVTIDQITLAEEGLGVDSASSAQEQAPDATAAAQDPSGQDSPGQDSSGNSGSTGHKP